MLDTLFVYGSLRSGNDNPHARKLKNEAKSLGPATVRGSIVSAGAYTGYKPETDGLVQGELWRLDNPVRTFASLDEYEGPAYSRVVVNLEMPSLPAWIYLYIGS